MVKYQLEDELQVIKIFGEEATFIVKLKFRKYKSVLQARVLIHVNNDWESINFI